MPDITLGASIAVTKGNLNQSLYAAGVTAAMSQAGLRTTVYTLSTTATAISTANLTSVGIAYFRNIATDTAATAVVSVSNGGAAVPFAAPRPGEPAMLRLAPGVSFSAVGHTAAILRVDITEG